MNRHVAIALMTIIACIFPMALLLGQDTGARDTIAIKCPTIVPSDHLIAGDSFRVEVYLYNDEILTGFSAGLGYNSDLVAITSVDFTGSILPSKGSRHGWSVPAGKQCLIGYTPAMTFDPESYIPARAQRGLLCALNFRMLPSITAGNVDIFVSFVPPGGFLELVSGICGMGTFVPEFADCGVGDIQLGGESGSNLVAFYNFNEGSGSIAHDVSGNGNNGTLTNGPTWTDGKFGKALDFDGADDYVLVPDSPSLDINIPAITYMAWIYSPGFHECGWVMGKGEGSSIVWHLLARANNYIRYWIKSGGVQTEREVADVLTVNTWQHMAVVYDGAFMRVYRDGIARDSFPKTGNMDVNNFPLYIGLDAWNTANHFYGKIDEVKIFREALTVSQIQREMGGFVCGDANADAVVDIADAVYLINYIFKGGAAPSPLAAGDANCDSVVDIADAVYLITYIFKGGLAPCAVCK